MIIMRCPKCRGTVVKRGYRYNESSEKQLYMCKKCGRKITPNDGMLRMRHTKDDIKTTLRVSKQMSLREASKELHKRGIEVSHQTIAKWSKKYKSLIRN